LRTISKLASTRIFVHAVTTATEQELFLGRILKYSKHFSSLNTYVFGYITPCSVVKVNRGYGRAYRLRRHGRRISQAANQFEAGSKKRWFFGPEDGGDMFFRNVG
jgi:hypothetical protein